MKDKKRYDMLQWLVASAKEKISGVMKAKEIGESERNSLSLIIADINAIEAVVIEILGSSKVGLGKFTEKRDSRGAPPSLKEYVNNVLREAINEGVDFSIIIFDVSSVVNFTKKAPTHAVFPTPVELETVIKICLRRRADLVMVEKESIFVILPETGREEAAIVANRLCNILKDYLTARGVDKVNIGVKIATSLDGGNSFEEIVASAR